MGPHCAVSTHPGVFVCSPQTSSQSPRVEMNNLHVEREHVHEGRTPFPSTPPPPPHPLLLPDCLLMGIYPFVFSPDFSALFICCILYSRIAVVVISHLLCKIIPGSSLSASILIFHFTRLCLLLARGGFHMCLQQCPNTCSNANLGPPTSHRRACKHAWLAASHDCVTAMQGSLSPVLTFFFLCACLHVHASSVSPGCSSSVMAVCHCWQDHPAGNRDCWHIAL